MRKKLNFLTGNVVICGFISAQQYQCTEVLIDG